MIFDDDRSWGRTATSLYRVELSHEPALAKNSSCSLVWHGPRTSAILSLGGHKSDVELSRDYLEDSFLGELMSPDRPFRHVEKLLTSMEAAAVVGDGHVYITFTIVVVLDARTVWTCLVSPHAMAAGTTESLSFLSRDLRMPVLRETGVVKTGSKTNSVADKTTSIFCAGTPDGYQFIEYNLGQHGLLLAMDRYSVPFPPLPTAPMELGDLRQHDAGWGDGYRARTVMISSEEQEFPPWKARAEPLLDL